jgi:hypothetical protein
MTLFIIPPCANVLSKEADYQLRLRTPNTTPAMIGRVVSCGPSQVSQHLNVESRSSTSPPLSPRHYVLLRLPGATLGLNLARGLEVNDKIIHDVADEWLS